LVDQEKRLREETGFVT